MNVKMNDGAKERKKKSDTRTKSPPGFRPSGAKTNARRKGEGVKGVREQKRMHEGRGKGVKGTRDRGISEKPHLCFIGDLHVIPR